MTENVRMMWRTLSVFLLCALTTACGGGGGGGGSVGGSALPPEYTGVQTPATLTQTNAEEIALSAYSGGSLGSAVSDVPAVTPSASSSAPSQASLATVLADAVQKMNAASSARPLSATPINVPSPCGGGSLTGSIDNSLIGSFSGVLKFENFCEGEVFLNGRVPLSGVRNAATGAVQVTFTFDPLTVAAQGDTFALDGTMAMTLADGGPTTLGLNLVLTDGTTGKTQYMAYTLTVTTRQGYGENVLSGRYYSHDHGFVEVTTQAPVRVPAGEHLPDGGLLRLTGAQGSWANLSFEGFGIYRIDTSDGGYIPGEYR